MNGHYLNEIDLDSVVERAIPFLQQKGLAAGDHAGTARLHQTGRGELGAQKGDVLRLVVGQGMMPVSIGMGLGIIAALGVTRLLSSLLYGVKPTDPLTFASVLLVLAGVAALATYLPAWRASKVDPMVALRYE